jgi:hypothetical protein
MSGAMLEKLRKLRERLQRRALRHADEDSTVNARLDASAAAAMHHDSPDLGGSGLPPAGYVPSGQDEGRPRR